MIARLLARRPAPVVAGLALAALTFAGIASTPAPAVVRPTAPAAVASPLDLDCSPLTREQTQTILNADPSDPYRLDRDQDAAACERSHSGAGGGDDRSAMTGPAQISTVPGGTAEAGHGSGGARPVDPSVFMLIGTGALLATGAGLTVWSGRGSGRARRISRA